MISTSLSPLPFSRGPFPQSCPIQSSEDAAPRRGIRAPSRSGQIEGGRCLGARWDRGDVGRGGAARGCPQVFLICDRVQAPARAFVTVAPGSRHSRHGCALRDCAGPATLRRKSWLLGRWPTLSLLPALTGGTKEELEAEQDNVLQARDSSPRAACLLPGVGLRPVGSPAVSERHAISCIQPRRSATPSPPFAHAEGVQGGRPE